MILQLSTKPVVTVYLFLLVFNLVKTNIEIAYKLSNILTDFSKVKPVSILPILNTLLYSPWKINIGRETMADKSN